MNGSRIFATFGFVLSFLLSTQAFAVPLGQAEFDADDSLSDGPGPSDIKAVAHSLGRVCSSNPEILIEKEVTIQTTSAAISKLSASEADIPKLVAQGVLVQGWSDRATLPLSKDASSSLCDQLCPRPTKAASVLDFCAFDDEMLAAAALEVDPDSVGVVLDYLDDEIASIVGARLDVDYLIPLKEVSPLVDLAFSVSNARGTQLHSNLFGAAGAAQLMTFVDTATQALAKVIVDRAKREAIGWLLDTMASEVCSQDSAEEDLWVRNEIERHWMPQLCMLAKEERAGHYGAGAAQMRALQAAIRGDLEGVPGAALGLLMGHLYFETTLRPTLATPQVARPSSVLQCNEPSPTKTKINGFDLCDDAVQIRRTTEAAVRSIVNGGDPRVALEELGTGIDRTNVGRGQKSQGFLKSPPLQIFACAVSIGRFVGTQPTRSEVMVALVDAPACWTLTGLGHADLAGALRSKAPPQVLAIDARFSGDEPERLSTLLRLHGKVAQSARRVLTRAKTLAKVVNQLGQSKQPEEGESEGPTLPPPPSFDGAKKPAEAAEAARAYLDAAISSQLRVERGAHFHALADRLDASTDLGAAGVDLLDVALASSVLPGLRYANPVPGAMAPLVRDYRPKLAAVTQLVGQAHRQIVQLQKISALVRATGEADWGRVANTGLALMTTATLELRAAGRVPSINKDLAVDVEKLEAALTLHGRHLGTLTAIATAENSDDMAEALDAAANPPGGWRRKLGEGNLTFSLTAHAGMMAAAEFRHGVYGAQFEDWALHAQAPTLFLPLGVELARGFDKTVVSVFVPLIDPAAFLGYDVSNDGRIPGPSPLTILSPGLAGRIAFGKSPFGLMLFGVFRPKYRTWKATVNGPGAHVIALGGALTVDVTLFRLASKGR